MAQIFLRPRFRHMISAGICIPVVDVSALVSGTKDRDKVAAQLGQACTITASIFVEHRVDQRLQQRLEELSKNSSRDLEAKLDIHREAAEPGGATSRRRRTHPAARILRGVSTSAPNCG
jgi:hypothetical protein